MTTVSKTEAVTREEIIARAENLAAQVHDRALEVEQLRRIPDDIRQAVVDAGLLRVATPERYGGYGLDYDVSFEIAMALARGCGSTSWCFSVWSSHNWVVGHFPQEAQDEYFAEGPDVVCASSVGPGPGKAEPVDGGYRLSGHWEFSSGCDGSTWELLGATTPDGPIWTLVPEPDFKIIDNWYVSGMRGTGSKDVVVEDVFVPAHRTLPLGKIGEEPYYGYDLHKRASYRLPLFQIFGWTLASPIVGLAHAAVEEFIKLRSGTTSLPMQLRLSEAAALADASRLVMRTDCSEMLATAAAEQEFDPLSRTKYGRNRALAVKLSLNAINMLFEAGGGHALFDSQPLQRIHRDAHAASHRTGLIFDLGGGEQWGRTALGSTASEPTQATGLARTQSS